MLKDCKQILAYTDDILDERASEQVRNMFFEHLETCEVCRNKFEISKQVKKLLRDERVVLGEEFTNAVMSRIRSVNIQVREKKPKGFWLKTLAVFVCCAAVFCGVAAGVVSIGAYIRQSESSAKEEPAGPRVLTDDEAEDYIQLFFTALDLPQPSLSADAVLSGLMQNGYAFADKAYRYISFVTLDTLDDINANVKTSYIPGYNNGKIYFYQTQLTQSELEWVLQSSTSEIYTLAGNAEAGVALVIVKM